MGPLRYTRQELANALQAYLVMDDDGRWQAWNIVPARTRYGQWYDPKFEHGCAPLPPALLQITDPPENWRDSLTAPEEPIRRADPTESVCEWRREADECNEIWETSCGHLWEFTVDGPRENNMEFCPFTGCGKPIQIKESEHGNH